MSVEETAPLYIIGGAAIILIGLAILAIRSQKPKLRDDPVLSPPEDWS